MDWRVPLFSSAILHVKPRQSSSRACDCNSNATRLLYRVTHGFNPGKRTWSWLLKLRRDCIVTLLILFGNVCNLILIRSRGQAGRKHIDFGCPPLYKKSASGTERRETSGVPPRTSLANPTTLSIHLLSNTTHKSGLFARWRAADRPGGTRPHSSVCTPPRRLQTVSIFLASHPSSPDRLRQERLSGTKISWESAVNFWLLLLH